MNSNKCNDNSAATAQIVKSCPQNHKEWIKAAARKGCEQMARFCSSFEYHCVINAWGNETIEVCAPKLQIVGKNESTRRINHQIYAYHISCMK